MMTSQLNFFDVHRYEKPSESQSFLEENRPRLSHNCKILFDSFMSGRHHTSADSPVGDFRRRRQDLEENRVQLTWKKVKIGDATLKEWWMDANQIEYNKKLGL